MLESTNSAYKFSLFKNLNTTDKPDISIDIDDIYKIIKFGFLKNEIEALRKTFDIQTYSNLKKTTIQAVTVSGLFIDGVVKHSGLIQVDLKNVNTSSQLYSEICNDTYTYLAFKNPDRNGINVIIKIKPSEKTHSSQFTALKEYYKKHFNLYLKTADMDMFKATLLSYDPKIYINQQANVFESIQSTIDLQENEKQTLKNNMLHVVYSKNEEENKIAYIIKQLTIHKLNLLDSDDKKMEIGYSIANTLEENGRKYYHKISAISPNYNIVETDVFYNNLLKKKKSHITLATLIHYANDIGITVNRTDDSDNAINNYKLQDLYRKLKRKRIEIAKKYSNRSLRPEI